MSAGVTHLASTDVAGDRGDAAALAARFKGRK